MAQKFRNYSFTNFNLDFDYDSIEKVEYMIVGEEICPKTKNKHHQGYVVFNNQRSFESVKKKLKGFHIEASKKCALANIRYCEKDGNLIYEIGQRPKGQGARTDIKDIFDEIKNGASNRDIAENYPNKWVFHGKAFKEYRNMIEDKREWKTKVYYIYGKSGSGKTKYAIEKGATTISFLPSGRSYFIENYNGEDNVLIDDIDETTFCGYRQLFLQLTDRYPMSINIKGSSRNWKPKKIFLTSNYPPCHVFPGENEEEEDPAVMRRIHKIIKM